MGENALLAELVIALTPVHDVANSLRVFAQQHLKRIVLNALENLFNLIAFGHGWICTPVEVDDVLYVARNCFTCLLCLLTSQPGVCELLVCQKLS